MAPSNKNASNANKASSTNNSAPDWRKSKAKVTLRPLLESGEISLDRTKKPKDIWEKICCPREEFAPFQYKNFPKRLKALRQKVVLDKKCKLPEPLWNHSRVQALLQKLIKTGEISLDDTMSSSHA